jgi:hypothetical protein
MAMAARSRIENLAQCGIRGSERGPAATNITPASPAHCFRIHDRSDLCRRATVGLYVSGCKTTRLRARSRRDLKSFSRERRESRNRNQCTPLVSRVGPFLERAFPKGRVANAS